MLDQREQHFIKDNSPKGFCYNIQYNLQLNFDAPKKVCTHRPFRPKFSDYEILLMLELYGSVKRVAKMIGAPEDKLFEYLQAQGLAI